MARTNRPGRSVLLSFLSALIFFGAIAAAVPEPLEIEFLPPSATARTVTSPDAKMIVSVYTGSVSLAGARPLENGSSPPLRLIGHDRVTRLCFFENPRARNPAKAVWRKHFLDRNPQPLVAIHPAGKSSCRFDKWVNRIGDKVLPLALLHVSFDDKTPEAGTPLVDADGKIVGLILQPASGQAAYAIPAQAVRRVQRDIADHRELVRGWLGISLSTGSNVPRITRVWPGSPAEKAGLREQDILVKAGQYSTQHYPDAVNALFYTVPGESTSVEILRDNKRIPREIVPVAQKPGN